MARGSREIKVLITGDASKLAREIGTIEGRMGKMSGVMKGALAGVSFAAIGRGLMGVAQDFQDAAIAANDFATASGLSVEEASRWQEVAGDLGVDVKKLETTFGRLSKNLGKDEDKFKAYGVQVARTEDGMVDANKTFLNAVGVLNKIEDPLERANIGSELFGRSWADLAPLVEMSAEDLTAALNDVGDAQVIDEAEVEKAKKFRETMDTLNDSTMGLKLTIAEALLPAMSGLAEWIGTLDPKTVAWTIGIGATVIAVGKLGTAISGVSSLLTLFAAHPVFTATVAIIAAIALIVANWDSVSAAIQRAIDKVDEFSRKISSPAFGPFKAINNALGGSFGKGTTELGPAALEGRANGGPVRANVPYVVGERQPELFVPKTSGTIVPSLAGIGGSTIINVYPPAGSDSREIAREVERERQRAQRGLGLVGV